MNNALFANIGLEYDENGALYRFVKSKPPFQSVQEVVKRESGVLTIAISNNQMPDTTFHTYDL